MTTAFDPIDLAGLRLANRIVMAPMTRSRAYGPGLSPTEAAVAYYGQRASAGLIITEGTQPSPAGQGYPDTPGLHSAEQVAAWRKVTDAVHTAGGRIFAQLMHTGRIGHPSVSPHGLVPVSASPVAPQGRIYTADGPREYVVPVALDEDGIRRTIADHVAAARNAIRAGFDGVEVHGANGYLVHQFLAPNSNLRTDAWGGDHEGRGRFAVELVRAVADAIGADRTGLRISPGNPLGDIDEPDPDPTYLALVRALEEIGPAYLHLTESADRALTLELRKRFSGVLILNARTVGRPSGPEELTLIEDGTADMLSYGALFLANPDLPRRLRAGGPFNTPDRATFYGGDERGYTDYPALDG
ncbi:N-ethylmaleimide reductase [Streptomyces sp. DvalAA-14]|uniref:alkene reductase n=1 Tax=unclassified Streptomyces TaxID=2593676 RepID=UPI00081B5148|nr:alkene reductase [Streptomyces sp. DvalAA-14]MYS25051.1 alkene reductase [Streptomyces sp. SID4948]SCE51658.1 N-ethylmaleimide reductase [Streptomyces sp. DvalAA-14]